MTDRKGTKASVILAILFLLGLGGVTWATATAAGIPKAEVMQKSVREGSVKGGGARGGRTIFVGGGFSGGK